MYFEIIGKVTNIETIAISHSIRELTKLREQYGEGRSIFRLTLMKINSTAFAICTSNQDCEDLQLLKVYPILPDRNATAEGYVRVIDDSGEDYLYPDNYFMVIELPPVARQRLLAVSESHLTVS
jgi:hypothetical protein